jgi:phage-related protein
MSLENLKNLIPNIEKIKYGDLTKKDSSLDDILPSKKIEKKQGKDVNPSPPSPKKVGKDVNPSPSSPKKIGKDVVSFTSTGLSNLNNLSPILSNDIINRPSTSVLGGRHGGLSAETPSQPPHSDDHSIFDNLKPFKTTPLENQSFDLLDDKYGEIGVNLSSLSGRHEGMSLTQEMFTVENLFGEVGSTLTIAGKKHNEDSVESEIELMEEKFGKIGLPVDFFKGENSYFSTFTPSVPGFTINFNQGGYSFQGDDLGNSHFIDFVGSSNVGNPIGGLFNTITKYSDTFREINVPTFDDIVGMGNIAYEGDPDTFATGYPELKVKLDLMRASQQLVPSIYFNDPFGSYGVTGNTPTGDGVQSGTNYTVMDLEASSWFYGGQGVVIPSYNENIPFSSDNQTRTIQNTLTLDDIKSSRLGFGDLAEMIVDDSRIAAGAEVSVVGNFNFLKEVIGGGFSPYIIKLSTSTQDLIKDVLGMSTEHGGAWFEGIFANANISYINTLNGDVFSASATIPKWGKWAQNINLPFGLGSLEDSLPDLTWSQTVENFNPFEGRFLKYQDTVLELAGSDSLGIAGGFQHLPGASDAPPISQGIEGGIFKSSLMFDEYGNPAFDNPYRGIVFQVLGPINDPGDSSGPFPEHAKYENLAPVIYGDEFDEGMHNAFVGIPGFMQNVGINMGTEQPGLDFSYQFKTEQNTRITWNWDQLIDYYNPGKLRFQWPSIDSKAWFGLELPQFFSKIDPGWFRMGLHGGSGPFISWPNIGKLADMIPNIDLTPTTDKIKSALSWMATRASSAWQGIGDIGGSIGQFVNEKILNPLAESFLGGPTGPGIFSRINQSLTNFGSTIGGAMKNSYNYVGTVLSNVYDSTIGKIDLNHVWDGIEDALGVAGSTIRSIFDGAASSAHKYVVMPMKAAWNWMKRRPDYKQRDFSWFDGMWTWLGDTVGGAASSVAETIHNLMGKGREGLGSIGQGLGEFGSKIASTVGNAVNYVGQLPIVQESLGMVKTLATLPYQIAKNTIGSSDFWDGIGDFLMYNPISSLLVTHEHSLLNVFIKPLANMTWDGLKSLAQIGREAGTHVKNAISTVTDGIATGVDWAVSGIKNMAGKAGEYIGGALGDAWGHVRDGFMEGTTALGEWYSKVSKGVKEWWKDLKLWNSNDKDGSFSPFDFLGDLWHGLSKMASNAASTVTGWLGNMAQNTGDYLQKSAKWVGSKFSKLGEGVSSAWGKVKSVAQTVGQGIGNFMSAITPNVDFGNLPGLLFDINLPGIELGKVGQFALDVGFKIIKANLNPIAELVLPELGLKNPLNWNQTEYGGQAIFKGASVRPTGINAPRHFDNQIPFRKIPGINDEYYQVNVPQTPYAELGKAPAYPGLKANIKGDFYPSQLHTPHPNPNQNPKERSIDIGDAMTIANLESGNNLGTAFGVDPNPYESQKQGMPVYFKDYRDQTYIIFRGYVEAITENVTPSWSEENYVGRSEPAYTYERATRDLSFTLKLFAHTPLELDAIYAKMRRLTSLCYPEYKDDSINSKTRMKPPFLGFRMGELYGNNYMNQLAFLKNVTYTVPDSSPWEYRSGMRVPKHITVATSLQLLHRTLPKNTTQFNGYVGAMGTNDILTRTKAGSV